MTGRVVSWFRRTRLLTAAALLLGVLIFACLTAQGPDLTPDSSRYMTFAMGARYQGDFYVKPVWPPLYPWLLSLAMLFTGFPCPAATVVAGACVLVLLLSLERLLRELDCPPPVNWLCLLVMVSSLSLIDNALGARSAGPFAALMLASAVFVAGHARTGLLRYYLAAAACVSGVMLSRYAGYALGPAFTGYTLCYLLLHRPGWRSAARYLGCNVLTYVPSLLYLLRNHLGYQTLHGTVVAPKEHVTLSYNIHRTLYVVSEDIPLALRLAFVVAMVLLLVHAPRMKRWALALLAYLALVPACYVVLVIGVLTVSNRDPISSRYLAPVYPFCLLLIVGGVSVSLRRQLTERPLLAARSRWVIAAACLLLAWGLVVQAPGAVSRVREVISRSGTDGVEHISSGFRRSGSLQAIRSTVRDALAQHDEIRVAAIHNHKRGRTRPHVGRSLFYHPDVFACDGCGRPRIARVRDHDRDTSPLFNQWLKYISFSVRLKAGAAERIVHVLDFPAMVGDEHLAAELRRMVADADSQGPLYLFMFPNDRFELEDQAASGKLAGLHVKRLTDAGPYAVYRVSAPGDG